MAQVSASLVKELRERTGAGMMDCKKALEEAGADIEAAGEWLRKKGLAAAAKKAGRVAAEGLVAVQTDDGAGAIVEVNSETDFVARNEGFQEFVMAVTDLAMAAEGEIEALKGLDYPETGRTVEEELTHLIATIGENMSLRRAAALVVSPGVVASYVHNAVAEGLGKIGVLVALQSEADPEALSALGRQIAMHVAAAAPRALSVDELDAETVDKERNILKEQALASGKPAEIVDKMVEGRLRKFYEEVVLLNQTYVIDGESKVSKVLEQAGKDLGAPVEIAGFVRFQLGEGVERKEDDFAAEVAQLAG
jgi:elongation factor Ts